MFHRPKTESDLLQNNKAVEVKNTGRPATAPQAPVTDQAQAGFMGIKDRLFDTKPKEIIAAATPAPAMPANATSTTATPATVTEDKKMSDTEDNNTPARTPEMPAQASAFQKPGIGPRVPGAYPGAFPGGGSVYGSSMTTPGATSAVASDQRKLVVGQGITMSGEIECCDTLLVEGTVEAALKGASVLHVAETGVFYGTVEIDEATIAGRFEGDLKVNGRLTVKATGSITGSIVYKELAIDAGATIDGKVSPIDGNKNARKDAPRKNAGNKGSGNDGNELPFSATGTNG